MMATKKFYGQAEYSRLTSDIFATKGFSSFTTDKSKLNINGKIKIQEYLHPKFPVITTDMIVSWK
jgi:hypothetical protein